MHRRARFADRPPHDHTQARAYFQTAHYERLAAGLPQVIATATATRDSATGDARAAASALLADAYIVAANFVVKLNDDPLPGPSPTGHSRQPRLAMTH